MNDAKSAVSQPAGQFRARQNFHFEQWPNRFWAFALTDNSSSNTYSGCSRCVHTNVSVLTWKNSRGQYSSSVMPVLYVRIVWEQLTELKPWTLRLGYTWKELVRTIVLCSVLQAKELLAVQSTHTQSWNEKQQLKKNTMTVNSFLLFSPGRHP